MEDGSSPLVGCIVFVLFIIFNGIFYGFGAAIQNLNESDVEQKMEEGDRKAKKLCKLIKQPSSLIQVITIITTLLGICFGTFGISGLGRYFSNYIASELALILVILIAVILLLSLGVFPAKRICASYPEKASYLLVNFVCFFLGVFKPLAWIIVRISNLMLRLFGVDPDRKNTDVTEEEIISIVDEAHEQGVIRENEAEMIQNIIGFSDKTADAVMTHRKNVVALKSDMTLDRVIMVMLEEGFSRYPVYQNDLDDVIGILHFKDVVKIITEQKDAGSKTILQIPELLRKAVFIPGTRSISAIFQTMQHKKIHMVIVVDEYGQTDGLVALEDILEEIVGEIEDEYDEEELLIQPLHDSSVLMDGLTQQEDVEEELKIEFSGERFDTLNGYLTNILGHVPTQEDREVITDGYRFQILSVANNVIEKVRAEKIYMKETKGEDIVCQDILNSRT